MNAEKSFKLTRQNLYSTMAIDGIGDIASGMIFLSFGSLIYFDAGFFIFIIALIAPCSIFLRKKITRPRIGYYNIESPSEKQATDPRLLFPAIVFLVLGIAIGATTLFGINISNVIWDSILAIVGLFFAISISAIGLYTGIKRLYLYGIALCALFVHAAIRNYPTVNGMDIVREAIGAHIIVFGAIILLTGLVVFFRFLIKYPIERDTENAI